jgi:hypothetical protein
MMGLNPRLKIIQATHTGELAVRFGRKIRNLMNTKEYKRIFPNVTLRTDNQAAGRWETNHGGEYFAAGVGGAITGRGADLLIIDDPHSEQDALSSTAMENAYEWYTSGPRQRLQPGGSIAIVMTRWSQKDLTANLVKKMAEPKADKWEVIEFPAILDDDDEEKRKPIWPQYWKLEELDKVKASLVPSKWNMMELVLLSVSGGIFGKNLIHQSVLSLFKAMTLHFLRKKPLTTLQLPLGVSFIQTKDPKRI